MKNSHPGDKQIKGHKQDGAVLFVSLMILLILTLIGVSSLNGSLMEEKMAANSQISTTVFQGAESAIKTAYYQYKPNPDLAYNQAQNRATTSPLTVGRETRQAQLVLPLERIKPRLFNSSAGTFVARGIEITGTASQNNITESNTQGYSVFPLRP